MYIIDRKISPELKDLLSKLLCVKPSKRYNIEAIKSHPWYKKYKIPQYSGVNVGF